MSRKIAFPILAVSLLFLSQSVFAGWWLAYTSDSPKGWAIFPTVADACTAQASGTGPGYPFNGKYDLTTMPGLIICGVLAREYPPWSPLIDTWVGPVSPWVTDQYYTSDSEASGVNDSENGAGTDPGGKCDGIGNPINVTTGNKYLKETYNISAGPKHNSISLYYNSFLNKTTPVGANWTTSFSKQLEFGSIQQGTPISYTNKSQNYYEPVSACELGWNDLKVHLSGSWVETARAVFTIDDKCKVVNENDQVVKILSIHHVSNDGLYGPGDYDIPYIDVFRENGGTIRFQKLGDQWISNEDTTERLENLYDADTGEQIGYQYITRKDENEKYDLNGRLLSITDKKGIAQTFSHNPTSGFLESVDYSSGESLTFTPDAFNRIATLQDHTGRIVKFQYGDFNNLEYVIYPDGTPGDDTDNPRKRYHYEDASFPQALTGITDERNIRYATYGYDSEGRAILSTHAGDAQRVDILYNSDGTRTVTNSRNVQTIYDTKSQLGVSLVTEISGPGCSTCGQGNTTYEYDSANNNLLAKIENGIRTEWGNYDENGNPGYKIEAVGTPEQHRTDYIYDPRFHSKVATIVEPSVIAADPTTQCTLGVDCKVTTYTYDDFGNRTSVNIMGFAPIETGGSVPVSRTTVFQYSGPLNQLSNIDGSRTDVQDIYEFDYYLDDAAQGNNRARLKQVLSPSGLLLRNNIRYSGTGKILYEERPNGLTLQYTYYPGNDRLESVNETVGSENRVIRWTYLPTGEVETITLGYGSAIESTMTLGYDDARRLTGITDALGNQVVFVLDTEGNLEQEKSYDQNGELHHLVTQTYDIYNRLDTRLLSDPNEADEINDSNFAPDGTLSTQVNAKNVTTSYQYDSLHRLTHTTGDSGGTEPSTQDTLTQYTYDVADRVSQVIAPNNATTSYVYDDLGNLLKEASPDRGVIKYSYDEAGNVKTMTDARGILVTYSYDALNRITSIDYPSTSEAVIYHYDSDPNCTNGAGRLCTISDASGITEYAYDSFGNIDYQVKTELGVAYTTDYTFDILNRLTSVITPNGRNMDYELDELSHITQINTSINGSAHVIASNIQYRPDGLLTSMDFGNGYVQTRDYNLKARQLTQSIPDVSTTASGQAFEYYVLNPRMSSNSVQVVSLVDGNTITVGTTVLILNKNQNGSIPASELFQGAVIRGTGAFSVASTVDGTDTPVPASFAGTSFVVPHYRGSHSYFLMSPNGNANAIVEIGGIQTPITLLQGEVVTFNAGTNNTLSGIISSDLPIVVSHLSGTNDAYAVPPASLELVGIRTNNVILGALEDATSVTVYASNGATRAYTLNKGGRLVVGVGANGNQGQGNAIHIYSNRPIAAIQGADSDGSEATAFWNPQYMATRYGVPIDTQYIALACLEADTTITLSTGFGAPEVQTCSSDGTIPGKAYFGSGTNGAHVPANSTITSDQPIYLIYETAAANDEHNLFGSVGALPSAVNAVDTWVYDYDENGNVSTITNSKGERIYDYDALDRLTDESGITSGPVNMQYDRNGNRTSIVENTVVGDFGYWPNSNKLDTDPLGAISHDDAGNRTGDRGGSRSFEYNDAGRMWKVYEGGQLLATYTYNAMGQRTRKVTANSTTIYHYDLSGSLITETTETGETQREYVYMGSTPVAQIDVNGGIDTLTYLHTDHLGTPRRATSEVGQVVWSWDSDAFGKTAANDDPDNDGISTIINLRFPGQYYDAETALHYNYHRYYDPSTGRYITSDPIGLDGGLNTYSYVLNNPLYWIDPFGLEAGGIALPNPNKGIGFLGDILPPWVLKGPGMCLFLLTYTSPYDPDVAACDENPTQCPYYNEENSDESDNQKEEQKAREKGKRFKDGDSASDQYEGIQKEQNRQRKQGDNTSIQSIEKSRQRDRDRLRPHNIDLDNLDDFY